MAQARSRTIVLAGALVALLGVVMVLAYARNATGGSGGGATVAAFVATRDIAAGTAWESAASSVAQRSVPESLRPVGALSGPGDVTGRKAVRRITKGEVVMAADFGKVEAAPGAGLQIPTGFNAVTMNLAPPQGVAHYAQPGDLVNIYVTLKSPTGEEMTKLLLPNVQVLANRSATAQQSNTSPSGEVLLSLALTPVQSEQVIFAKENGSLWFGLVHPGDKPATTGGRTSQNVLG